MRRDEINRTLARLDEGYMKLAPEQFERILRTLQGPPVGHDKRRAERFPLSTPIDFARPGACDNGANGSAHGKGTNGNGNGDGNGDAAHAWAWTTGVSRDISELGLGLLTMRPAERGTRIVVKLPDGAGGSMMMACNVAHSRAVADGLVSLGLEFVEELTGDAAPQAPGSPGAAARPTPQPAKTCCGARPATTR